MRALISDIHANLAALEAVLADIAARGVTDILSMGDVVGYGGEPNECISLLRQHTDTNILGNHDNYITTGQNCDRSKVVASIIDRHRPEISDDNLAWLQRSVTHIREGDVLWVHGGPNDPTDEYLTEVGADTFPDGVATLFAGHTHVQTTLAFENKMFCNPGSVGQPRDGDPRAAWALWHGDQIELCRTAYDIERTVSVMRDKGYEEFMWKGLYEGAQLGGRVARIARR